MLNILALIACNSVRGAVDGDDVPALPTAFFVEDDEYFGNDGIIRVFLSSTDLGCEGYDDLFEDLDDEAQQLDVEGYSEVWRERLPEDFWEVNLTFRVSDTDDKQSSVDFDAQDWDDGLGEDDEAKFLLTHFTDYPGDTWSTVTPDSQSYTNDGGTVSIRRHTPNELISGTFDAEVVDASDGDDEGEVRINFSASRCSAMEGWLL